ncbi:MULTISPECIES: DUF1259 domain-containing protein [Paenibacillus]|uniref:DUF1259 domain-containing protein n=1 Tax=Paenibacillus azoreducens TaxID=116718 RepID=A0A919YJQ5_9BACL|nr:MULTISPECIES: DUF1259 domain-containing protein [Paenibacillus]MBE9917059.1 DUF1259 domain-containing protein [Paenibacillus donghaensis]GIO50585.1 hypothetical protein J34TS1_53500 [Paenibacillus azoreducens]
MAITESLCRRLAQILGGKGQHENNECSIMVKRNLNAKILGKKYDTEHEIVIQSLKNGKSLNTGEITLLQREVQQFIRQAARLGLKVTAVHNHWLFDTPRLMYVHVESVENPIVFARKLASIIKRLKP